MEGGVNAFLRSRPPLDVPPAKRWPPSKRLCRGMVTACGTGCALVVCLYLATCFGFTVQGAGLWILPLVLLPGPLLFPTARNPYRRHSFWSPNWPFRSGDPKWIKAASVLLGACAVAHLLYYLYISGGGAPEMLEDGYALVSHGIVLRTLSASNYLYFAEVLTRSFLLWDLMFWFMALALWVHLLVRQYSKATGVGAP